VYRVKQHEVRGGGRPSHFSLGNHKSSTISFISHLLTKSLDLPLLFHTILPLKKCYLRLIMS